MARHAHRPTPSPANQPDQRLAEALQALRHVWIAPEGTHAEIVAAVAACRALIPTAAATHEMQATLERGIATLERLPADRVDRNREIERIAGELKALQPLLALVDAPGERGKLNAALGERRAGRPAPPPKVQVAPRVPRLPMDAAITELKNVGPKMAALLEKLGVSTLSDLLHLTPRRYLDYRNPVRIGEHLDLSGDIVVRGTITQVREHRTGRGPSRTTMVLDDGSGELQLTFFIPHITRVLVEGTEIYASGTVERGFGRLQMVSPEWERVGGPNSLSEHLLPVYPLTKGINQRTLRNLSRQALDAVKPSLVDWLADIRDAIPERVWERMPKLEDAFEHLHYPPAMEDATASRRRMALENLILLQLGLVKRRADVAARPGIPFAIDQAEVHRFLEALPFLLTGAQQRALDTLLADVSRPHAMTRLLQGDVGSGKTVVAAAVAVAGRSSGHQTALMAPTEILAEQHERNLSKQFMPLPEEQRPEVALLTGSTPAKARRELLRRLAGGEIDVLIGTHALIQDDVVFHRLGLVIIDEQHRFGVRQRSTLAGKADGAVPHLLSMTATPIPRTLNLVLYGDMDVSVIDERPPGRVPIVTRRYVDAERRQAYELVREQIALGHQVFVICPLVEASDLVESRAAVDEALRLQTEVFPELKVEVLHGRMPGKQKDAVMSAFRDRQFDILVATSVIEVGIDIPNATVMMIEGADRFGLSQLHQFRGRVGRGDAQSWCLLLADGVTPDGEVRLNTMVETDDGFRLAETDLDLRGPGDFLGGTRQSGLPDLGFMADGFDTRLLAIARDTAEAVLKRHGDITWERFPNLYPRFRQYWASAGAPEEGKS